MPHRHSFTQDASSFGPLLGEQRISRRSILRKLAGLTLAGGSTASFVTACGSPTSTPTASQTSTGSPVSTLAASHTGPRIPTKSDNATEHVSAATHGGDVYTYRGHTGRVNGVAWSPDGKRIASASADFTVQVWDATNGGHVYTY